MARAACFAFLALLALPHAALAQPASDIDRARALLAQAEAALRKAESGEARLAAVGRAIRAQEAALAALRRALRSLGTEEKAISGRVAAEERDLEEFLSVLQSLARAPRSALLAHPGGPADAARAAALMTEITPVLDERISRLEGRLARLARLRARQREAETEVRSALAALQTLRAEGASALAKRRPAGGASARKLVVQADAAAASADTLASLAEALGGHQGTGPRLGFDSARGNLPLPVAGDVVAEFGDPDPNGNSGQGWSIEVPAFAHVAAPWDGTIRFAGRLGAYGNVVVLEPETGYLMLMAGLGRVDRQVGEVVLAGETLGDMGGPLPSSDEFLFEARTDSDLIGPETLYLELRHDGDPVDPAAWFQRHDR